jgi:hypothetical protein
MKYFRHMHRPVYHTNITPDVKISSVTSRYFPYIKIRIRIRVHVFGKNVNIIGTERNFYPVGNVYTTNKIFPGMHAYLHSSSGPVEHDDQIME